MASPGAWQEAAKDPVLPSDAGPRMLESLAKCGDKQSLLALLATSTVEVEKAKEAQTQKTWAWNSRAP